MTFPETDTKRYFLYKLGYISQLLYIFIIHSNYVLLVNCQYFTSTFFLLMYDTSQETMSDFLSTVWLIFELFPKLPVRSNHLPNQHITCDSRNIEYIGSCICQKSPKTSSAWIKERIVIELFYCYCFMSTWPANKSLQIYILLRFGKSVAHDYSASHRTIINIQDVQQQSNNFIDGKEIPQKERCWFLKVYLLWRMKNTNKIPEI